MESKPWTKNEYFAWNDGRRIVDLQELAKQLHCKQCRSVLDLQRTEKEARYGFASILYIHCSCGLMNDVHTCRVEQNGGKTIQNDASTPVFEINNKASLNILMHGGGSSSIVLKFLALLDIPVSSRDDACLSVDDACLSVTNPDGAHTSHMPSTVSSSSSSSAVAAALSTSETESGSRQPGMAVSGPGVSFQKSDPLSVSLSESDHLDSSVPEAFGSGNDDDGMAVQVTNNNMYIVSDIYHVGKDGGLHFDNSENSEDMNNEAGSDDDDEEYIPPAQLKLRLKPAAKLKKTKSSERPRNVHTRSAARKGLPQKRISPRKKVSSRKTVNKLKIQVKEENDVAASEGEDGREEMKEEKEDIGMESTSKDFDNYMDWSSTESEGKPAREKESDSSLREESKLDDKPKRKRGRPKGSTDRAKRTRWSTSKTPRESRCVELQDVDSETKDVPQCTVCMKDFNSIKGYNVHMKRVHNQDMKARPRKRRKADGSGETESEWEVVREESVSDSLYLCPECHVLYSQPKCLCVHLKKYHQVDTDNVDEHGISMEGSIVRQKLVWKKGGSLRHRFSFRCLRCQTTHPNRSKLSTHIRVLADQKLLTCETESPDALRLGSYQGSMFLRKAESEDRHLCHLCGATFKKKGGFRQHVSTHTEAMSKILVCDRCPFSTGSVTGFKYHRWRYHSSKPRLRSHICEFCGKGFFEKSTMRRHMENTHIKDKNLRCELCSKVFTHTRGFRKHMRNHRIGRHFECMHCGRCFKQSYNLKVHERLHTGEKPYQCQHCQASFAQKNSLDVHMKKHQKKGGKAMAERPSAGERSFGNERSFVGDRSFAGDRSFTGDGSLADERLFVDERSLSWHKNSPALARKHNLDSHIHKLQEKVASTAVVTDPGPYPYSQIGLHNTTGMHPLSGNYQKTIHHGGLADKPFECELVKTELLLKKSPSHGGLSEGAML